MWGWVRGLFRKKEGELSRVAGILNAEGRLARVIVDKERFLELHVCRELGETIVVLPHRLVREPVEWEKIPRLIEDVRMFSEPFTVRR